MYVTRSTLYIYVKLQIDFVDTSTFFHWLSFLTFEMILFIQLRDSSVELEYIADNNDRVQDKGLHS